MHRECPVGAIQIARVLEERQGEIRPGGDLFCKHSRLFLLLLQYILSILCSGQKDYVQYKGGRRPEVDMCDSPSLLRINLDCDPALGTLAIGLIDRSRLPRPIIDRCIQILSDPNLSM